MILGAPVGLVSPTGVYSQPVLNRSSLDKRSVQRYRRCWMKSTSAKRLHGGLKSWLSSINASQLIKGLVRNGQQFPLMTGVCCMSCRGSLAPTMTYYDSYLYNSVACGSCTGFNLTPPPNSLTIARLVHSCLFQYQGIRLYLDVTVSQKGREEIATLNV